MEDRSMSDTSKASITYYGTTFGERVVRYDCAVCESPLVAKDTPHARILVCTGPSCGRMVGFARNLPKPQLRGQLDINGEETT
jgi:hypothetical protein